MDQLGINAASGMRSWAESLDLLANNLANAGTSGFKADREFYSLFVGQEASGNPTPALPVIERAWTDFAQGILKSTAEPLDFALAGPGFFVADSPGGPLLTRNGSFRVSPQGLLQTQDGFAVRIVDPDGNPRRVLVPAGAQLEVQTDGTLLIDGQPRGRFAVVEPEDPGGLTKQGASYFRLSSADALRNASAEVRQGQLESSNVGPAETSVRLITILRHFEMLQKAMVMGGEMNRKAVEEVARVTG